MENNNRSFTKALKTPSPPAKMKLFLESFDNFDRPISTSGRTSNSSNSSIGNDQIENRLSYLQNNIQQQFNLQSLNSNQQNSQVQTNQQTIDNSNKVHSNNIQQLNKTSDSMQIGLKTEDYNSRAPIKPLSSESQRASLNFRSKLGHTGDGALTGDALTIVKKYRDIQAQRKVTLVLDDEEDDEEDNEDEDENISGTPSFKCSSDEEDELLEEEEDQFTSQETNSQEPSTNEQKPINKNLRPYKSDPQLSSYEDSEDPLMSGGMYQDSIRYHSQNALKKSSKVFETVTVCDKDYYILNEIGEGGSSKVYQVCDFQKNEFYALKVVDMSKMAETLKSSLEKEIEILNMLKGCKRVIQLYAYEMNRETEKLMLVMEKGDSDLNTVLHKMIQNDSKKKGLDLHTIKHYWNEMLKAVDEIHKKGVVHSDLKPVNFVIVKGYLKIIDFGIADAINPDHTSVVKCNLVGTINFMSPESLMGRPSPQIQNGTAGKKVIKVNCKSDVWSLGCILYNMCYGRTPFGHIEQIYEKINAICNPKFIITYPPYENADAIDCMKKCLLRNSQSRPSVAELFQHPFLNREQKANERSRLQTPSSRVTTTIRNPLIEKRIFDDIGSEVNQLTPRSLAKFKIAMKKELIKMKK